MQLRFLKNDIRKNRFITIITTLFVAAAAMLVALAAILIVHLTGAISHLMTQAQTPHYYANAFRRL